MKQQTQKIMVSVFFLVTGLVSCSGCGSEVSPLVMVDPPAPEGSFFLTNSLTSELPSDNIHYYKTYDVQGKALNTVQLTVESEIFVPHIKLFYGDELVSEATGGEFYNINRFDENAPRYISSASFFSTLAKSGNYRILVTSAEQSGLGEYRIEYYSSGFSSVPLSITTGSSLDAEGYYFNSYERPVTQGKEIFISVTSTVFNPRIKLYYQGRLLAENFDNSIHDAGTNWVAQLRQEIPETGTYQIVITTVDKGVIGKFLVETIRGQ